jgi:hypothetical protein
MLFIPPIEVLPGLKNEIRCVTITRTDDEVPPGVYAFVESFCDEEDCDCRRAFIHAYGMEGAWERRHLATIGYGWEDDDFYADWMHGQRDMTRGMSGARLEPMQAQSESATYFLRLFRFLLEDSAYAARIERHYAQFREALPSYVPADDADDEEDTEPNVPPEAKPVNRSFDKVRGALARIKSGKSHSTPFLSSSTATPFGLTSFLEASAEWSAVLGEAAASKIPAVHDIAAMCALLLGHGSIPLEDGVPDDEYILLAGTLLREPHAKRTRVPDDSPTDAPFRPHAERAACRAILLLETLGLTSRDGSQFRPMADIEAFFRQSPVNQYCAILWAYLVEFPWTRMPILRFSGDRTFLATDWKRHAQSLLRDFLEKSDRSPGEWISLSWFDEPPRGLPDEEMSSPLPFAMEAEYFLWEPLNWLGLQKLWIFRRDDFEAVSDGRLTDLGRDVLPTLVCGMEKRKEDVGCP